MKLKYRFGNWGQKERPLNLDDIIVAVSEDSPEDCNIELFIQPETEKTLSKKHIEEDNSITKSSYKKALVLVESLNEVELVDNDTISTGKKSKLHKMFGGNKRKTVNETFASNNDADESIATSTDENDPTLVSLLNVNDLVDPIQVNNDANNTGKKSNIQKLFGDNKRKPVKNNNKRDQFKKGKFKQITVDEKERVRDIMTSKRAAPLVINNSSNRSQVTTRQKNIIKKNQITITKRHYGSRLHRSLSNTSRLSSTIPRTMSSTLAHDKSYLSGLFAADINAAAKNSKRLNVPTLVPFNFKISLDSIDGISCVNLRNIPLKTREKLIIVISYFNSPTLTGDKQKYNIRSMPLQWYYDEDNGDKVTYEGIFEEEDDMGQDFGINSFVGMIKDKQSESGYAPRAFYLEVGLMKVDGGERIKLGNAILPLHGNENETNTMLSIPVGNTKIVTKKIGNKKTRVSQASSKTTIKGLNSVSFPSNPYVKYSLDNAMLNISCIRSERTVMNDVREKMVIKPCSRSIRQNVSVLSEDGVVMSLNNNNKTAMSSSYHADNRSLNTSEVHTFDTGSGLFSTNTSMSSDHGNSSSSSSARGEDDSSTLYTMYSNDGVSTLGEYDYQNQNPHPPRKSNLGPFDGDYSSSNSTSSVDDDSNSSSVDTRSYIDFF
jgi:hypothetical protein